MSLKAGRDANQLPLHAYLVADGVIASKRETMEDTLRHLDARYGGIDQYARLIGLTQKEITAIKENLCITEEPIQPVSPRSSVTGALSHMFSHRKSHFPQSTK